SDRHRLVRALLLATSRLTWRQSQACAGQLGAQPAARLAESSRCAIRPKELACCPCPSSISPPSSVIAASQKGWPPASHSPSWPNAPAITGCGTPSTITTAPLPPRRRRCSLPTLPPPPPTSGSAPGASCCPTTPH